MYGVKNNFPFFREKMFVKTAIKSKNTGIRDKKNLKNFCNLLAFDIMGYFFGLRGGGFQDYSLRGCQV